MDFPSAITVVFFRKKMVRESCRLLGADKMAHYLTLYAMNSQRGVSDCRGAENTTQTLMVVPFMRPRAEFPSVLVF